MKYYPFQRFYIFLVILILGCVHCERHDVLNIKDNFVYLAQKYGFEVHEHDVVTEDGYILKLFHIPGDKNKTVLLLHGVLDSSNTFIVRGRTSLVSALVARGYDIWLGNNRGNLYSLKHTRLDAAKNPSYWDFSFHEMGIYDVPAFIDFILRENKIKTLNLIAHSQGTQLIYVMGAMRPEYNEKVNIAISLGPVAFLNVENFEAPLSYLVRMGPTLKEILEATNQPSLLDNRSTLINFRNNVCRNKMLGYKICGVGILFAFAGEDLEEFEPAFFYEVLKNYPCTTSTKNGVHLMQGALTDQFRLYDYGLKKNLELYYSSTPPSYELANVTMKVALLVGANDKVANLKNALILKDLLPNVVDFRVLEPKKFNHIDFVWGRNMNKYLFPHIFKLLATYA